MLSTVQIADMAVSGTPYMYSKKHAARATPNNRKRWLIPVLLAGQILLKVRLHTSKSAACNGAQPLYMPDSPPLSARFRHHLAKGVLPLLLQMLVTADAGPAEIACRAAGWCGGKVHVSGESACCSDSDRS